MGDRKPARRLGKPWFKLIKVGFNRQPWPVSWQGVAVYAGTIGGIFWLTSWVAPRLAAPYSEYVWVAVVALLASCFLIVLRTIE